MYRYIHSWLIALFCAMMFIEGGSEGFAHEEPIAINENTGATYTNLQQAISEAGSGNTIKICGTFVGTFTISQSLNLVGKDDAALDGNQSGSVLTIGNSSDVIVKLCDLTIRNGLSDQGAGINNSAALTLHNVKLYGNSSTGIGGGIYSSAPLTILHSHICNNLAADGGGIYLYLSYATLTLKDSEVSNNSCTGYGGGIYFYEDSQNVSTICHSKLIHNNAPNGGGGAIYLYPSSVLNLDHVEIERNSASSGGGILNDESSTLTISNSHLTKNFAYSNGGGLYNNGTLQMFSSKVTHNIANGTGGGIFNVPGALLELSDTKVKHNHPNDISDSEPI